MKLKVSTVYSQRDPRWSSDLLGYNTNPVYSIGGYGCLISSFGMYIGMNPDIVNETLKVAGGFTTGSGNFIWSKCSALGLAQVYQSPFYSDPVTSQGIAKIKALLDEGRPLITHIDFDPSDSDDDQHWILVYGYDEGDVFYACDPWTGTRISLDVYGGVKRCVYEWRAYDKVLQQEQSEPVELDACRLARDSHWNDLMAIKDKLRIGGEYSKTVVLAELDKLVTYEDAVVQKDRKISGLEQQLQELEQKIIAQTVELTKTKESIEDIQFQYQAELETKTVEVSNLRQTVQTLTNESKTYLTSIQELKTKCKTPVFVGWKKRIYDFLLTH